MSLARIQRPLSRSTPMLSPWQPHRAETTSLPATWTALRSLWRSVVECREREWHRAVSVERRRDACKTDRPVCLQMRPKTAGWQRQRPMRTQHTQTRMPQGWMRVLPMLRMVQTRTMRSLTSRIEPPRAEPPHVSAGARAQKRGDRRDRVPSMTSADSSVVWLLRVWCEWRQWSWLGARIGMDWT